MTGLARPDAGTRVPLRVVIRSATADLAAAGVSSPAADAQELAAHLLGVSRTRLGLTPLVGADFVEAYRELVARRAERVPLQHLIGSVAVAGTTVFVGPGVFVPRPETEALIEWSLQTVRQVRQPLVVDLCTGSGAIALAIAAARPDARVIGVDNSAAALAWARRSAADQPARAGGGVELRGGDVLDPLVLADVAGRVDLVTANPPYVPAGAAVPPEVARHDPPEAVFAGPDGLDLIRPLISVAAGLLSVGGRLAIEHDDSQVKSVPALLRARGVLDDVVDHADLTGRPRFVTARRVPLAAARGGAGDASPSTA